MREGMRILVAYDKSEHAENALKEAVDLAKKYSGALTVVHCCWNESDEESKALLAGTEGMLKEAGVKYELRSERTSNPPGRIIRVADEEGFDLVAIGSRGIGGARAWLMGSVSNKVAAEAQAPVLILK